MDPPVKLEDDEYCVRVDDAVVVFFSKPFSSFLCYL